METWEASWLGSGGIVWVRHDRLASSWDFQHNISGRQGAAEKEIPSWGHQLIRYTTVCGTPLLCREEVLEVSSNKRVCLSGVVRGS